ncbi:hypothetical protein [Streptomyces sp. NPDC052015]|uniref:hypothetical protein n=1 Tax=Streptomyces sp. NPDC052015 TaxID=3154755 RepID=UPI00341B0C8E
MCPARAPARAWETWTPDRVREVTDAQDPAVRVWHEVQGGPAGDRVTFTETFDSAGWDRPRVSRATLRFLGAGALSASLAEAGRGGGSSTATGSAGS